MFDQKGKSMCRPSCAFIRPIMSGQTYNVADKYSNYDLMYILPITK